MITEKKRPATSLKEQTLIPVIETGNELLIDAQLLHQRLQIQTRFDTWITRRIKEYGFVENLDFRSNLSKSPKLFGRPRKEYHLTIDMAKELAMVERTAPGRMIRQYFISVEKEYRAKRLYGQTATLTELRKKVPTIDFMGRQLYQYRSARRVLGYSAKSSGSYAKRYYPTQFAKINGRLYVSEEYVKLMIQRATVRRWQAVVKEAKPIALPQGFGQLDLFNQNAPAL